MVKKRLYEIDILRFLAAMMVVFYHFSIDTHHSYNVYLTDSEVINSFFLMGNFGVRLFFIISGFVILMSAQFLSSSKFVTARIIRLYPAFVPLCLFTFIFAKFFRPGYDITIKDLVANISLVGLFATWGKIKLVTGAYWTLIVEMQFYIYLFLLIWFKKIAYIRTFLWCWLILSITTYYGELYFNFHNIFNKLRIFFITEHSFYFIAGCYFYLIKFQRKKFDLIMPFLIFLLSIICFINHKNNVLTTGTGILLGAFFVVFYLISLKDLNITKNHKLFATMGALTYPLYLVHEIFGTTLIYALLPYLNKTLVLVVVVLFVLGLVYLFNIVIEEPLMLKLRLLLNKPKKVEIDEIKPIL